MKNLKEQYNKLTQRHNRLEKIFNSISDMFVILDTDLNIVLFSNHILKKMFPKISKMDNKCYRVFHGRENVCPACPALNTLKSKKTLHGEKRFEIGKFAGRYFEWTTSPIKNSFGEVREIVLFIRDITNRKEYEFRLMNADRMSAIVFLAAGIAHEINNPLASIAGFSEGLQKRLNKMNNFLENKDIELFDEYLGIINNEVFRCNKIIQNIQEFTRTSSIDYAAIDINKIIINTISLVRQHAKDNHIKILFQPHRSIGSDRIPGKESQLKHLFLNLFFNLCNELEKGQDLCITTQNDENRIEICMTDPDGRFYKKLSRDFICFPSDIQSVEEEDSFDLAICYNIIKHHKGNILLKRIKGDGNFLQLTFPLS